MGNHGRDLDTRMAGSDFYFKALSGCCVENPGQPVLIKDLVGERGQSVVREVVDMRSSSQILDVF